MRETLTTLFIGAMIGLMAMAFAVDKTQGSYYNIVNTAIKECEKSLPRDQHCKIVALPVDKE